ARVLADDHPLVDLGAGSDEHHPARLEVVDRVGGRAAGAVGDQGAVLTVGDLALPGVPAVEQVVEKPGAPRVGEELGAVADEAAGGDPIFEPDAAGAVVYHLG